MKLLRKVLFPLLGFFLAATVLLVLLLIQRRAVTYRRTIHEKSAALISDWNTHLGLVEVASKAIAVDWANNPAYARALAERDRETLLQLVMPSYEALKEDVSIQQAQFHLPPATSFLRLHAPDSWGDDLSSIRPMIVRVNTEKRPLAGLEVGRAGLGMRAVVPVFYRGQHVGSVEVGMGIDDRYLALLKETSSADWVIWLLPRYASVISLDESLATEANEGSMIAWASTLTEPVMLQQEAYRPVLEGERNAVITPKVVGTRHELVFTYPLRDYSGTIIGIIDVFYDESAFITGQQQDLGLYLFLSAVIIVLGSWLIRWLLESRLALVGDLDIAVRHLASGDLDHPVTVTSDDEIGDLAEGVEQMRRRLKELMEQMGRRIEERTAELNRRSRLLAAVASLSRLAASMREPDELMQEMAERMTEELGFYHVGIFLRDARGAYMVLQAASSEGGRKMVEQGHRLRIGETGIVGYVASTGRPRIAQATSEDVVFFDNPYLPQTQAEMALPLRVEDEIIGVLDVQATAPNAFEEGDIFTMQMLADQLALALTNIRLLREARERLQELNRLIVERSLSHWRELVQARRTLHYFFDGVHVHPADGIAFPDVGHEEGEHVTMEFPLEPRPGEVIGRLRLKWPSQPRPADLEVVQAATAMIATTLEEARLFTESQQLLVEAELLYRLQRQVAAAQEPGEIAEALAEGLFHGELDRCIVMMDQGDGRGLFAAFWGAAKDDPMRARLGHEITLPSIITRSDTPLFFDDLSAAPIPEADRRIFLESGVSSIAIVPLIAAGERWGWLFIESVGRLHRFSEQEKRLLRVIAEAAAVALQNIFLVEHAQHMAERERQVRELSDQMQRAADVEHLLQQLVRSLRTTLGASYAAIRLGEAMHAWIEDESGREEER